MLVFQPSGRRGLIQRAFFDKLTSEANETRDIRKSMRKLWTRLAGCCILMLCMGTQHLVAQQTDLATKLRLAQSLEQAGEWGRAASLYESLLEDHPTSFVIVDGLRRTYTELKQYDKAKNLIRQQLRNSPADENLLTTLGSLHDLSGEQETADSLWQVVISKDPKNTGLYRLVAAQLIDHRQYERAIQVYRQARTGAKNETIFVEELSSLYAALHQYESATKEFVTLVRVNPQQVSYVQSRLASFTSRPEGWQAATGVVRGAIQKSPETVQLHQLLAWLLIEGKNYEGALDEYRIIDQLTKANGSELFQFGQRAAQERAYGIAALAFREALDRNPPVNIVAYAKFGFARATEELSIESDSIARAALVPAQQAQHAQAGATETWRAFQNALGLYENLLAEYPNSDVAMQALFRIGTIRFNRLFDLDGAITAFDNVRRLPFNAGLQQEASISLGEVETAKNNIVRAREEYALLLRSPQDIRKDNVRFRLAELDYYEGKFDTASTALRALSANLKSDETNDALQLLYFIEENKVAGDALREFARADLLVRQRKYSEAQTHYRLLAERFPSAALVDDAVFRIAELSLLLNHPADALGTFQRIIAEMPTSVLRDRAQMRIAEVYERLLKDNVKAVEAYERLLEQFPTSLFVEEARKRIRALRGEVL